MYNVSNGFKEASKQPVQEHRLTGTVGNVSFDESNVLEGSFNIQKQCTDSSGIVLGSAYIGQLTATFTGLNISRGSWVGKTVTPSFGLKVGNSWEDVPLGSYKIKEVVHTAEGTQVTAYDNMSKFDKVIKRKKATIGFVTDSMYDFVSICCEKCHVTLATTKAEIDALPNGYRQQGDIEVYGDAGDNDFANDIETYRDLLYWCCQTMGAYATMNRYNQLVIRPYTQTVVEEINDTVRLAGAHFEDYITHFTGIYVTDMDTNGEVYYGYDASELTTQLEETAADISDINTELQDNAEAQAELEHKHEAHEITDEEYAQQKAELVAEAKDLRSDKKKLEKRLGWLEQELQKAQDDDEGATLDLGANPFLQYENITKRDNTRRRVLTALANISYTPFTCSLVCGAHYDLGDVIHFTGGHASDDYCCVMSWSYTHNQGTELEGFGTDTDEHARRVKDRARKDAHAAGSTAANTGHTFVGESNPSTETGAPRSGKSGDVWIQRFHPHLKSVVSKEYGCYGAITGELRDIWYSTDTVTITCNSNNPSISGNFISISSKTSISHSTQTRTGADVKDITHVWWVCRVPVVDPNEISPTVRPDMTAVVSNLVNYDTAGKGYNLAYANDGTSTIHLKYEYNNATAIKNASKTYWYFIASVPLGTFCGGLWSEADADYNFPLGTNIRDVLVNDEQYGINIPDEYEGEEADALKYCDTDGAWKDLQYVHGIDTSDEAGGTVWNGLQEDPVYKRLSLKKNVMRAWYKADPPQTHTHGNFSQFCVRYTGEPDKSLEITSHADHTWANIDIKTDDENAFKIKSGGIGGSGKYCSYAITGLTVGTRYYFNFAANFSDNATFGGDVTKGLGLVFNTTGEIATDAWAGAPDTFNEETLYYSMRRDTTKHYADFDFEATATTMYMCVVTADVTSVEAISLTLSEFVISKSERKLIRNFYLYDYEKNTWLKYKPFGGTVGSGGDSGGSVVEITPTLSAGTKIADYSIDGATGELYAPNGGGSSDLDAIEITYADYQSLTPEEKADPDKIYFITDYPTSGGSLEDLSDVDIDDETLSDGQVLTYDEAADKWVNENAPTPPTVGNGTITIQKNGTNVNTFTTNQSSNKTVNITMSKSDVGLGNVDNTSDAAKPISTATQAALNNKANTSDLASIKTVMGNPISISDGSETYADELSVDLEPIQSGSGTPSPSNVRPIQGYDIVSVDRCGKNLFDGTFLGYYISGGTNLWSLDTKCMSAVIPIKGGEKYTITRTGGNRFTIAESNHYPQRSEELDVISTSSALSSITVTPQSDSIYLIVYVSTSQTTVQLQVEHGEQSTTYEPYNGTSLTVPLGQTVYGATVDVANGSMVVNRKIWDATISLSSYSHSTTGIVMINNFYTLRDVGNDVVISDSYVYQQPQSSTISSWLQYGCMSKVSGYNYLYIRNEDFKSKTLEEIKTILEANQFVYELATPITIPLTPAQLKLLKGYNYITSNGTTIHLTYQPDNAVGDAVSEAEKYADRIPHGMDLLCEHYVGGSAILIPKIDLYSMLLFISYREIGDAQHSVIVVNGTLLMPVTVFKQPYNANYIPNYGNYGIEVFFVENQNDKSLIGATFSRTNIPYIDIYGIK